MGKRNEGHRHKFLDGPLQAAMLRALFPQAAFMPTQRSIYAMIQLHSRRLHSTTRALIDSGATDNFVSPTLLRTSNWTAEGEPIIQRISHATNLAASAADKTERTWQEQVPLEYHQFGKVFSNEEAQRFPNSRPWDHEIELTPDTPQVLNCKVYPLAEGQQELLDQFLDEHLKKGYIRVSNSPYASPFFFVKKNDGKQRPVQDYRQLNNHTVRNTYPLPLIKELVTQLIKKQWFTKFDVRWGYNNIRIKDGDQWKAAFKTNRGLFEPTVMFFGLTNSLATFQTMMDATFRNEVATGDVVIYMDDIF